MTFLELRDHVKETNPVLYDWMTEVARKFLLDIIRERGDAQDEQS